jgi:aspartate-semialdehyde dehydrogenase
VQNENEQMSKRIPVAVLGATGAVGQRFIQLLEGHPWFQVVALTGSERSAGMAYREACHWVLPEPMPLWARQMPLMVSDPRGMEVRLAFSALPSDAAYQVEPLYAAHGVAVCSNASAHRAEADVPLLLPEVNPQHTHLVYHQQMQRGWPGCIVTNPNCTITGVTVTLKALLDGFGVEQALMVSLQAVSGAGYPGVPSLDILSNVLPYIPGEEEKMEWEPRKMLGRLDGDQVELAAINLSAHANRVPVAEGHTVCLSVRLGGRASLEEVAMALQSYQGPEISRTLPSAPRPVIQLSPEPDHPQPRLDAMTGGGMTTVVGRLRPDPILDYKMVVLSHNTIRGAAGASIYNAELLVRQSLVSI